MFNPVRWFRERRKRRLECELVLLRMDIAFEEERQKKLFDALVGAAKAEMMRAGRGMPLVELTSILYPFTRYPILSREYLRLAGGIRRFKEREHDLKKELAVASMN